MLNGKMMEGADRFQILTGVVCPIPVDVMDVVAVWNWTNRTLINDTMKANALALEVTAAPIISDAFDDGWTHKTSLPSRSIA